MKHWFLSIFIGWALWGAALAHASESAPVDTGKVVAQLVSSHESAGAGETINLALRTVLDDHWHTYWRNPGDSGEPVQIDWTLPEGASAGEITWPLPKAIPTGPIINFGFEGVPLFPVEIKLPETAQSGDVLTLEASVYYLVCKDICIPESTTLSLDVEIGETRPSRRWDGVIKAALSRAPKQGSIKAVIEKSGETVSAGFTNLPQGDFSKSFFFPYPQGLIAPSQPQTPKSVDGGLLITGTSDYMWDQAEGMLAKLQGVLSYDKDGKTVGEIVTLATQNRVLGTGASDKPTGSITFIGAILGAFLGGLILNLMPCVFPVISIKALSMVGIAHEGKTAIRREGWLYTAGVFATFLLLTLILLAVKAAGTELGWGFQLQSPKVIGALALLLFTIGLNLLGVFEFGSSLQNTGSGLAAKGGASGAFFTGALAVIVATPCTAPFMAGAVGYALSQPALITIAVFMALAFGFALPFLALSYAPSLLQKLPKPGPWMVRLREFLAFPMLGAAIWLVWVLSLQSGEAGLGLILIAMLLLAFGLWCLKRAGVGKLIGALAIALAIAAPLTLKSTQGSVAASEMQAGIWTPETVQSLRADGKNVFVDFTAAWCVTCKVNEKTVLSRNKVKDLFKDSGTALLVADWTNKDDVIAAELARHGRSGVPLYLFYPAGHNTVKPQILPQILTETVLREALLGE